MLKTILFVVAAACAASAIAQDKGPAKAAPADKGAGKAAPADKGMMSMEILRDKVKADKKLIVMHNMNLTDAEAKAFWPIYDAYQKDLVKINERLAKAVVAYADAYKGPMSNETAKKLLDEALAIEDAELKLKRSYVPKLAKAVPATKVALYIQMETKIRALVRFELAANIPLVE